MSDKQGIISIPEPLRQEITDKTMRVTVNKYNGLHQLILDNWEGLIAAYSVAGTIGAHDREYGSSIVQLEEIIVELGINPEETDFFVDELDRADLKVAVLAHLGENYGLRVEA